MASQGPARAQALKQKAVASFHFGHKKPCRHQLFAATPTEQLRCCTYGWTCCILFGSFIFFLLYCIQSCVGNPFDRNGICPQSLILGHVVNIYLAFITSIYDHDHEVVTVPIVWDVQIGPVAYYNYKRFLRDLFLSYLRV